MESSNRFDRDKGFMSNKLFNIFLENAQKYASSVVIGFFGEPMLHPNFEEFVRAFPKKRSYQVILNTNWSLTTEKNMEVLKLFDCIRVSMDASNAGLYEILCPGGPVLGLNGEPRTDRYTAIVQKIKYWLDMKPHPTTFLVYVVSSMNKEDKPQFLQQWLPRINPGDSITTKRVISYGGCVKDSRMRPNPCDIANGRRLTVGWNGDCSPCNLDVNLALNVGNLFETENVKELIETKQYRQVLEGIHAKEGICRYCFDANNHVGNKTYTGKVRAESMAYLERREGISMSMKV
jgi:hypothetical protein